MLAEVVVDDVSFSLVDVVSFSLLPLVVVSVSVLLVEAEFVVFELELVLFSVLSVVGASVTV